MRSQHNLKAARGLKICRARGAAQVTDGMQKKEMHNG